MSNNKVSLIKHRLRQVKRDPISYARFHYLLTYNCKITKPTFYQILLLKLKGQENLIDYYYSY